jgi:hypothetical protein
MPRVFRGEPASLAFAFEAQLRAAARAARENGSAGDDSGEPQNNQQQAPLQPNVAAAPAPDEIQVVDAVEVETGAEDDVTEQDEHAEEAAPVAAVVQPQAQPRAQPRAIPRARRFRHTYRYASAAAATRVLLTARGCWQ